MSPAIRIVGLDGGAPSGGRAMTIEELLAAAQGHMHRHIRKSISPEKALTVGHIAGILDVAFWSIATEFAERGVLDMELPEVEK